MADDDIHLSFICIWEPSGVFVSDVIDAGIYPYQQKFMNRRM